MTNEVIVFFAMLVMAHCVNTVVFAVKHKDEDEPWRKPGFTRKAFSPAPPDGFVFGFPFSGVLY